MATTATSQTTALAPFQIGIAAAPKLKKGETPVIQPGLLVVFASQTTSKAKDGTETTKTNIHHDAAVRAYLEAAIEEKSLTGKAKEIALYREAQQGGFRHLLVVGLGSDLQPERLRAAGGQIAKAIADMKTQNISILTSTLGRAAGEDHLRALTEGLTLGGYSFTELKSKKADAKKTAAKEDERKSITLIVASENAKLRKVVEEALVLAETVNFSRRLGDLPGNLMTPTILADTVKEAVKGTAIKFTAWDGEKIRKERMGGLWGVAQGSAQDPRFIILEYAGGKKGSAPIVFVGKGLTFDTGGISIKPSASMEEMKYDMCGGANVLGALLAIARLKLKVNAVALVPATENMPGSRATKPGDVHTARNGKTFEVNNTDAEGRLILSDALCYGSELKPRMMVDAATLTGAMVVALGNIHTGFYTRDAGLAKRVDAAASDSGELVWRMPLVDFHADDMKGTFADLNNISNNKGAGSATAAAFLEQFVDKGIPWAHFDIAGTGWAVGNRLPYSTSKGASGAMVRTFVELARSYED